MLARETGWTFDYIFRRAPLAMLLRIYHAALWANGAWTIKRTHKPLESLFPAQQTEDEDDE